MIVLQDWSSDSSMLGPFDEESAWLGYTPGLPTNRNLIRLLQATFGLGLGDTYATNLFPFIKLGGMDSKIPRKDLLRAAEEFALPQIRIVNPKHVICAGGFETFNALRRASGLGRCQNVGSALQHSFVVGRARIWCQAHTGARGQSNRGGAEQVGRDWLNMKQAMLEGPDNIPC
jgi:restriction system protein